MPNIKYLIKNILRWLDYHLGIRAWLSSEPKQLLDTTFLTGEKELDYGWVIGHAGVGPGKALDVGGVNSPISSILVSLGFEVTGVDLRPDIQYELDNFIFINDDFLTTQRLLAQTYDLVVLCSTVEHIGLFGRYENRDERDGDLLAMKKVFKLLKPKGICILTIPVGQDGVYAPWHRIYGEKRLPQLLDQFHILESRFFVKKNNGKWSVSSSEDALAFKGNSSKYAIGQFVLSISR
jgi:SAM-dependent methyltransferase